MKNYTAYLRQLKYGAMFMLCSCAHLQHTQPSSEIKPFYRVSNSPGSAYGYYLLGTYYAGQKRNEQAAEAYRQAIEIDPDLADAHNALGMLHAGEGRYVEAIASLVNAARVAPKVAKFHNNLGYVYHLKADYSGAVTEFRRALALDAHYSLASNNLLASCERMGVVSQRHRVVLANGESRLIELAPCPATSLANHPADGAGETLLDTARAYLRRGAEMITGLATSEPPPVLAGIAVAIPSENARSYRLEISNGNGVPGLAQSLRDTLRPDGAPTPRLTNMKTFTQRDTAIQYRPGFREAARLLSLRIPTRPRLFRDDDLATAVDVRLVLGKDMTERVEMAIREFAGSERSAHAVSVGKEPTAGDSNAPKLARE
ncbi:tetratricopeptide repeat protein [Massilia sp. R2A-15]|uniref:LytR C-terminal domain-containing protein n=1 Tax=Massilia sp. R2A-15 TaxID=3064278 RepID=UPI00273750CB|nr:LytR C-terminal domain-containing protein [Massilia sp. R2A-15]WLI87758.1 tetratricopeptide repeat protein [Massilia sp. R2A-15]